MTVERGKLYIVGTPIGNLEDLTLRAARVLREVDVVAAEDTRRSLGLLNHLGAAKRLVSYHEHNRQAAGEKVLELLRQGQAVALVTDAGMPCISDPGWQLVDAALQEGLPVEVVPGPSAAVAAVAASGLDGGRFVFEGFLPRQGKERKARLAELEREYRAVVFFEAPHRLDKTLQDLSALWPGRPMALCHDLTKRFERIDRGTAAEVAARLSEDGAQGEYVLVFAAQAPPAPQAWTAEDAEEALGRRLAAGMDKKQAIREVADLTGLPKKQIYRLALEWEDGS
jgi:16S rRNA (cytidine1402-2'-O)-methyltransferase